jgi:hypothetical protein
MADVDLERELAMAAAVFFDVGSGEAFALLLGAEVVPSIFLGLGFGPGLPRGLAGAFDFAAGFRTQFNQREAKLIE